MNRINATLEQLKTAKRSALVPYITAGDPSLQLTVRLMHAMVEAGADIIELGVPFSDPMADGPVIQGACERALAKGVTLEDVLECIRQFRENDDNTALVIMGYLNPVESMGYEKFAAQAKAAGADGVLLVDLTVEESDIAVPALKSNELAPIFLVAPTSPPERVAEISRFAEGYLYYVSLKGVTGAASLDVDAVKAKLDVLREHTDLPIAVGFGIRDAASAASVGRIAEAVVVGSALVSKIESLRENDEAILKEVAAVLGDMRRAMDA